MLEGVMRYCEFPLGLKRKYQVYTCADLTQLREAGYCEPMMGLEEGGNGIVQGFLWERACSLPQLKGYLPDSSASSFSWSRAN